MLGSEQHVDLVSVVRRCSCRPGQKWSAGPDEDVVVAADDSQLFADCLEKHMVVMEPRSFGRGRCLTLGCY